MMLDKTMDASNVYAKERHRILATFVHEYRYGKALGGIERRFIEVSKRFPSLGIDVTVMEYPPSIGRLMNAGYSSVFVPYRKPRTVLAEAVQLVRLSVSAWIWGKRTKCELVYSPSTVYSQVIPAFFASFALRKPLVVVFHSPPRSRAIAGFLPTLRMQRSRGESIRNSLIIASIRSIGSLAYRRSNVRVAVSRFTAEQVRTLVPAGSIVVSGNGVGEEWFGRDEVPMTYDACFVGRISPRKRVDLLLFAWQRVVSVRPDAKLIVIGGGEDPKYVRKCQEMVRSLGLDKNVNMSGFLDDHQIRRVLDSSSLFVLPSSREGFGLVVTEAMARGVPCVLSSLPSLRENFGESALFVTRPEPEAWANSLVWLLEDEDKRTQMSESGIRLARRFRWEEVARREVSVMRRVMEPNINSEPVQS
jgi:glycosyltransferase involved in cell wall biosynthesis